MNSKALQEALAALIAETREAEKTLDRLGVREAGGAALGALFGVAEAGGPDAPSAPASAPLSASSTAPSEPSSRERDWASTDAAIGAARADATATADPAPTTRAEALSGVPVSSDPDADAALLNALARA